MRFSFLLLCFFPFFYLSSCAPVLLFTAGVATIDLATQERGIKGTISDTEIRADINQSWFSKNIDMYRDVHLSVQGGRVLLTGYVPTQEAMDEAVRLSWQAKGVKEVINELQIQKEQPFGASLNDVWISTQIRSNMLVAEGIHSTNYSVTTMGGTVYLLGVAQNQEEITKAIEIAKNTSGVQNVVNHVIIKEQQPQTDENVSSPSQESSLQENSSASSENSSLSDSSTPWTSSQPTAASIGNTETITEEKLSPPS